jgi:uncharacterized protein YbjQ (UPF0145 family)
MEKRRANNIVTSTTGELEGWTVNRYLGVISAHVVAGTGLFSDVAASFSDVFGGRSSSYKRQLSEINEEVTHELKEKAAQQGADAILGLRIDHDEISGQQKGMLMVTAAGTAVRAERDMQPNDTDTADEPGMISDRDVKTEKKKRKLLQNAQSGTLSLTEDNWKFLIENRVAEMAEPVRSSLLQILPKPTKSDAHKRIIQRGKDYFLTIREPVAKKHLYNMLHDRDREGRGRRHRERPVMEWALEVLEEGQMLDFQWVNALLDEEKFLARKRALEAIVRLDKAYYSEGDIQALRKIEERVTSEFEKKGEVLEVEESGMFSSETKDVWQIKEGAQNDMDQTYCEQTGLNIYGFGPEETKPEEAADAIREKVEVLDELL